MSLTKSEIMRFAFLAVAIALAPCGDYVSAQQIPTSRVRGTIEKLAEGRLVVKSRDGSRLDVQFDDRTAIIGLRKIELSDLPPDAFVGVAAVPGKDGIPTAVSIHLFPESSRGVNEGARPYDLSSNSSMTNGTVAASVKSIDGNLVVVKYKNGENRFLVTQQTSVVSFEPGKLDELQPGAQVVINLEDRAPGPSYASRVLVGRQGITPAM